MHKNFYIAMAFGVLLFGLSVIAFGSVGQLMATRAKIDQAHDVQEMSKMLLIHLLYSETGQRGYIITGNKDFLEPYSNNVSEIPKDLVALTEATAGDSELLQHMQQLTYFSNRKVDELREVINQRDSGLLQPAIERVSNQEGKNLMDSARDTLEAIDEIEKTRLVHYDGLSKLLSKIVSYSTLLAIGSAFMFVIFFMRPQITAEDEYL